MTPNRDCAPTGCTSQSPADNREPRQWTVTVPKSNGTQILFGRYGQRPEAETVAAALRAVGCPATVARDPKGAP